MKTIFSLLFASTIGLAFGQFIPQPMGYNPDENGDAFISVTDLQGMLALYGNAFDNGDSLSVEFDTWDVTLPSANGEDNYVVPTGTDLLYLTTNLAVYGLADGTEDIILPVETGFRSLMIALNMSGCCGNPGALQFWKGNTAPSSWVGSVDVFKMNERNALLFIHGHDGEWYFVGAR